MVVTGLILMLMLAFIICIETKDGGNIDFYFKPLVAGWLVVSFLGLSRRASSFSIFIWRHWWLHLLVFLGLYFLSAQLIKFYRPYYPASDRMYDTPNESKQ